MTSEVVRAEGLPRPNGHYSPVVKVGNLLFLAAQTGIDQATGTVPEGGFEPECRQAFTNIQTILHACGSSLPGVVRAVVLYTDLADLPVINAVFADTFPTDPPARTAAIVGLAGGRRISIEITAVVPSGTA
ncbi:RidA family protein [Winogradskya consettensis]|uniref:Endoribonuclease n=1 Tax=Winogradskya consettensis TaxID=113560 RepID=A0A919SHW3_9ACTN|nr:Rid family hydrolase [Actinoplanes consettensis]GIM71318.1 endoribonuclease [Actinoplanes consettensis]